MTDDELVAKKLAFIETCLRELRQLARPGDMAGDIREQPLERAPFHFRDSRQSTRMQHAERSS